VPRWLRIATAIAIPAIVLAFFAQRAGQTVEMVREAWQPVSWLYIALSYLLLILCLAVMALLWYGILRSMGGQLALSSALRFYGVTLLPRYVPGMVWGYAGRALLCEREGVSRKVAVGSAVVEVGLIFVAGCSVLLIPLLGSAWIALLGLPLPLLLLGLLIANAKQWEPAMGKLRQAVTWYSWTLAYVCFWLLYGMSSWLAALSVVPEVGIESLVDIAVRATGAWLTGFLAILVPAGLGVREGAFALALTPIAGPAGAVFIPLLARLLGLAAEVTFFFLSLLFRPRNRRKAPADQQDRGEPERSASVAASKDASSAANA
jgi:uncharacterized membrane protein YbhN (UPF0104 family)